MTIPTPVTQTRLGASSRASRRAAPGPFRAYDPPRAESAVYRKSRDGDWEEVRDGLPDGKGTTVSVLVSTAPGVFWAANNRGVYRSADGGRNWERLAIVWPDAYARSNVLAFSVTESASSETIDRWIVTATSRIVGGGVRSH